MKSITFPQRIGPGPLGHDLKHIIGQGTLQLEGLFDQRGKPHLVLLRRGQDHRHGFRVDRSHDAVRFRGQERVERQIWEIFFEYNPRAESLSLDETYLNVTENLRGPVDYPGGLEDRARIRQESVITQGLARTGIR
jgi:hypothetical protein